MVYLLPLWQLDVQLSEINFNGLIMQFVIFFLNTNAQENYQIFIND